MNLIKAYEKGIYGNSFEIKLAIKSANVLSNFLIGESVLELGCGFGYTTEIIAKYSKNLVIVEKEQKFINELKDKIKAEFICKDWFDFETDKKFSDIVLFRGLDYVEYPDKLLQHIKNFMDKNTKLHILLPNNKSIHRLVGLFAGIDNPFGLTKNDYIVGHKKSYNLETLMLLLQNNSFKIEHMEGIGFKPLSNSQMEKLDENIQNAFIEMGNMFIQNSAEVYIICKL